MFFEFSLTRQFGTKRNDNFYFLSLSLFRTILAWNEATIVFFDFFWIFFSFFWNFLFPVRSEGKGQTIFIFSLSRHFPTYFGMKLSHNGIFLFFSLFFEFYISRRVGTERKDNFCFLSFSSFTNLFWLEKKP